MESNVVPSHGSVPLSAIPPAQRAEALARRNGFSGEWPPRRVIITSVEDFAAACEVLQAGDSRAGLVKAVGCALIGIFGALRPADFRGFARSLLAIAHDRKNAPRTRLRAVEAAVRPLLDAVRLVDQLRQTDHGAGSMMSAHLKSLIVAFFDELGPSGYARFRDVLLELAQRSRGATRVRAVRLTVRITTDLARALGKLETQGLWHHQPSGEEQLRKLREDMAAGKFDLPELSKRCP